MGAEKVSYANAMSRFHLSFNAKCAAIFDYNETRWRNDPEIESVVHGEILLLNGKYDEAIAFANLTLGNNLTPPIILCLDIRLRAHMAKRQYKEALEDAVEMQIRVPGSYFGYSRAVQIHVIRDRFKAAFQTFKKGFDNLKQQQEIDTLARSIYMLDTAAADLGLLNQLEDAHELADMMVTLIPRSPIGYLRAGTVFLLQGRTDKALDMYNRGIARVQGNQQLIQHKEYVLRRFKSNDQISRAPYDILGWIVQYLDSHDLFTCLNVCYDWRVRFQQYPQPWRTIALCNRTNLDFLEHARAHIRAIYIPITDICMVNSCLKLVSGGAFPNLVHLEIDSKRGACNKKCTVKKKLSKESHQLSSRASDMLIHVQVLKSFAEQNTVLACPHFNVLIDCDSHKTQSVTLTCPTLRELVLDDSRYRNGVCNKNLAKPQQLFVQNSLAFNTVDSRSRSSDVWTSLPDITSPTLQKLSFSFDGNSKSKQWIGSCPELEEIILKNMENMDGSIFYAIKRLPKLRRLEIQSCKNYNRSRFESFFHMLAYKRDLVKLHTVILNDFNTVLPESLHAISRYRNLRSLRLIKCKIISADAIGMFATNLKEMDSLLEELMLTQIGAVTDGILVQVVVHIPRLQRLLLEHLSHITDDGIVQIVDRSAHTSLSLLGIHECSQVTEHGVGYAARRLSVKTNSSV